MDNVALKQDELDSLFNLDDLGPLGETHIWLVKNKAHNSILGGRNYSHSQVLQTLEKAKKDYPSSKLELIQIR